MTTPTDIFDDVPAAPPVLAPAPRTRWAGIVWGLALGALAAAGIWLASGAGRIDALATWAQELAPATAIGYAVLGVGALLLLTGLVGLLRRAQRAMSTRRHAAS